VNHLYPPILDGVDVIPIICIELLEAEPSFNRGPHPCGAATFEDEMGSRFLMLVT
jgi:hypothetical protein